MMRMQRNNKEGNFKTLAGTNIKKILILLKMGCLIKS